MNEYGSVPDNGHFRLGPSGAMQEVIEVAAAANPRRSAIHCTVIVGSAHSRAANAPLPNPLWGAS